MKNILILWLVLGNLSFSAELIIKNNLVYEKNSKIAFTGKGILNGFDGNRLYEGDFKKGVYDGQGTLYVYINDDTILKRTGEYKEGKLNGKGIAYNYDGTIEYEGYFKNDEYSGLGTYYWSEDKKIEGVWEKGKIKIIDPSTKKTRFLSLENIYSESFIEIYDTNILRFDDNSVGIKVKVKNSGSRMIGRLELLIEYKDSQGKTIYEKSIAPISGSSDNYYEHFIPIQYLKPNYIYQMREDDYFMDYRVPFEWSGDYKISINYLLLTDYGSERFE